MKARISWLLLVLISFVLNNTIAVRTAFYSTKTPYKPPSATLALPPPPPEYDLVCAQVFTRHGSRALEGRKYDTLTKALWIQAKEEDALTELGRQFGEDLQYFVDINDQIGRGELSELGRLEQQGLAHRIAERLLPLFIKSLLRNESKSIQVVSSNKSRTKASLRAFVQGLPPSVVRLVDHQPPNPSLLFFHENARYQTYFKKDRQLKNKLKSIDRQAYSKLMAQDVLGQLYQQSFIDKLVDGQYFFMDYDSGRSIRNEFDAVRMLHALYLIGSNLQEEGVGSLLEKYFSKNQSAWYAYLQDAKDYYEKGPGFSNQTITYDMAQILLDDFLVNSDQCSRIDATHFLRARFGHAEGIIPFIALLKIPILSDKQTPPNETYTYENNGWRGEIISPMSANIQWEIFRYHPLHHGRNNRPEDEHILVRMLLNEYVVPFKYECEPYDRGYPFFYTLNELKRCYSITNR